MKPKNILLFLFSLVIVSGSYGLNKTYNGKLITPEEFNAYLGSITWPDMPVSFKGEMAAAYGWEGDTIPSFDSLKMNYVLILPMAYHEIPALTFSTRHPNSKVVVTRAKNLTGSVAERTITFTVTDEDSTTTNVYSVLLKKEPDPLTIEFYQSTVNSKVYKVSDGYSLNETIKGVTTGTTVTGFYANITKTYEQQTLKVISAISGTELAKTDAVSAGDTLVVLSADGNHISKYILGVTTEGLSSGTLLTSAIYTISTTGSTGTITGFQKSTLLKTVLKGLVIPEGATLTMVDQNDAYKTLVKLNFDTAYVNVLATSDVYFEVIAENGISKVLYQLVPTSTPCDAYITSDLYNVDQSASCIQFVPKGTSVASLFRNVTLAPGATMAVIDKVSFVRSSGILQKDDKLVVTSNDGTTTKSYSFMESNFAGVPYYAFVISDYYQIDQASHIIYGVTPGTRITEFRSKLYPGFGTSLKVIDANGNESSLDTLVASDRLLVTAADGTQTATYDIDIKTTVEPVDASTISMGPNPSSGKVVIQRLVKGNRLRVLNLAGTVLRDMIAGSSTETISLDDQPSGIYLFAISAGTSLIKIQKIVKK